MLGAKICIAFVCKFAHPSDSSTIACTFCAHHLRLSISALGSCRNVHSCRAASGSGGFPAKESLPEALKASPSMNGGPFKSESLQRATTCVRKIGTDNKWSARRRIGRIPIIRQCKSIVCGATTLQTMIGRSCQSPARKRKTRQPLCDQHCGDSITWRRKEEQVEKRRFNFCLTAQQ